MKPRVLFITPLPPPVHGSAMVSQYIKDSRLVNEQHDCDFVNLSTSRRMDEIGKGGIKKLLRFVGAYLTLLWKLLTRRYDLCYLAITCHGVGFLKDAPFVLLCKLFRRRVMIHQHNKGMSACVDRWPYRWLLPLVYRPVSANKVTTSSNKALSQPRFRHFLYERLNWLEKRISYIMTLVQP